MSTCGFSKRMLHEWYDGAAGTHAGHVEAHLERCEQCSAEVEALRRASEQLRHMIDTGVGHVEPLLALQGIRQRIDAAERRSLVGRWRALWGELWLLHRRAMAGVVAAAALGALSAPIAAWWVGKAAMDVTHGVQTASVVVESLEYGDDATKAVVYNADDGMTTLIWVEPTTAADPEDKPPPADDGL